MSESIRIESDRRTVVEAETIKEGFLGHGFINTMRFSELNGPEEYDNTHLYIGWHALFQHGMKNLLEWECWIDDVAKDPDQWNQISQRAKVNIERTLHEIDMYRFDLPIDAEENIWVIRNYLFKYMTDFYTGVYTYDGHVGILNGRMARDKGHKKDLLKVTENRKERDREIEMDGERKKHFWQ